MGFLKSLVQCELQSCLQWETTPRASDLLFGGQSWPLFHSTTKTETTDSGKPECVCCLQAHACSAGVSKLQDIIQLKATDYKHYDIALGICICSGVNAFSGLKTVQCVTCELSLVPLYRYLSVFCISIVKQLSLICLRFFFFNYCLSFLIVMICTF